MKDCEQKILILHPSNKNLNKQFNNHLQEQLMIWIWSLNNNVTIGMIHDVLFSKEYDLFKLHLYMVITCHWLIT